MADSTQSLADTPGQLPGNSISPLCRGLWTLMGCGMPMLLASIAKGQGLLENKRRKPRVRLWLEPLQSWEVKGQRMIEEEN